MTLERGVAVADGAVIPPGRYWIDVIDAPPTGTAKRDAYAKWKAGKPEVKVQTTEEDAESGRLFVIFTIPAGSSNFGAPGVLFPTKVLGFPTVAAADVTTSDDTVQKPPPPQNALDVLGDQITGASGANLIKGVVFAAVAVGVVVLAVSVGPALLALKRR